MLAGTIPEKLEKCRCPEPVGGVAYSVKANPVCTSRKRDKVRRRHDRDRARTCFRAVGWRHLAPVCTRFLIYASATMKRVPLLARFGMKTPYHSAYWAHALTLQGARG